MTESRAPITNTKTGEASSVGGYANSGVHVGDVNLHTGLPVRNWYREQVRRIAPPELLNREVELDELVGFCTDPATRGRYSWWRADMWAGKSALMSWFLLHPPPNVRLVSFFITGRLASQNDRVAFGDNLLEQLAVILDTPLPQTTDSTRDAHLLGMLHEAAQRCQDRGEDFVLILDGLDEDRGVTSGRDAHSIAALLPTELPAGMRVILTGRPHPPVPDDVPDHHPIRDPSIVRLLSAAPEATVARSDMLRELRELLEGPADQQALLGFLTAAGGGLTALDLDELTGKPRWLIEEYLRTVAGRSFTCRGGYWRSHSNPDTYLLGHEELQTTAEDLLGLEKLTFYRDQLHEWADGYRARGWPADTPEYLLRGYFQVLDGQGDLDRMILYATDHLRHDRMLDASGGDAAALAEIAATQDVLTAGNQVDLKAMACLAMHRDHLIDRNVDIPVELPAVWAALGQPARAEALTRSIRDRSLRCGAALRVAQAMADVGNSHMAEIFATQALATIRAMVREDQRREIAEAAIDTMIEIGRPDLAAHFVEAAESPDADLALLRANAVHAEVEVLDAYLEALVPIEVRAAELSQLVETLLTRVGTGPDVPTITPTIMTEWITDGELPATSKVQLAAAAKRLIADRRSTDALVASDADDEVLAAVALAACIAGYTDAAALLARFIENPARRVDAVTSLATTCATGGDFKDAESLLAVCGESEYRAEATMSLAAIFATAGAIDPARALMMQRHFLIEEVMVEDGYTELKSKAARAWAALGDYVEAERVARSISGANDLARVFTTIAGTVIAGGDLDAARRFATQAETFARMSVTTTTKVRGFTALSQAFATAGDLDRAEEIANLAIVPDGEPSTLEHLATTFFRLGEHDRATRIAQRFSRLVRDRVLVNLVTTVGALQDLPRAEGATRSISTEPARVRALAHCVRVALAHGDVDRALTIALTIPNVIVRTEVLDLVLHALAAKQDLARIHRIVEWARDRASSTVAPIEQYGAEQVLAVALAASGDWEAVEDVLDSRPDAESQAAVRVSMIAIAALNADQRVVDRLVRHVNVPAAHEKALGELVRAAIARGDLENADQLVDRLLDHDAKDALRVEIVAVAAENGRTKLVEDVIDRIRNVEQRGWALAMAAGAGVLLPSLRDAPTVVHAVLDADARLELLLALVDVLAASGHETVANDLVRATPEPEHRSRAWAVLAENLDGEQAREAVALSLRWGRWTTSLDTLARLAPEALRDIQAEFFVLNPDNALR